MASRCRQDCCLVQGTMLGNSDAVLRREPVTLPPGRASQKLRRRGGGATYRRRPSSPPRSECCDPRSHRLVQPPYEAVDWAQGFWRTHSGWSEAELNRRSRCRIRHEAQWCSAWALPRRTSLMMRRCCYDPGSGCRMIPVRRGRYRIQLAIALLDPSRADMPLHRDADMVWAIAGTCRVKLLSGFAGSQGKNTHTQA